MRNTFKILFLENRRDMWSTHWMNAIVLNAFLIDAIGTNRIHMAVTSSVPLLSATNGSQVHDAIAE